MWCECGNIIASNLSDNLTSHHYLTQLLLFILNFYTTTSKHKVLRCGLASWSSTESSQWLSQQVNKKF